MRSLPGQRIIATALCLTLGACSGEPRAVFSSRSLAEGEGVQRVSIKAPPEALTDELSSVALGPISGVPPAVSARVVRSLDAAATRSKIALLNFAKADADYLLQGDLKATRLKSQIRLTYWWDVLNRDGKRVGGNTGVETISNSKAAGADIWREIPDASLQAVAEKAIAAVISRN